MFQNLPSLNAIKAFEAAARLSSFKDAANELHVTPTAISHQIRALEEVLKVRLFERNTRSISLTDEGKMLATTSNQSLQNLLDTVNQLIGTPRTLTISTTNSFAAMWLVPNLSHFQQLHPNIDIQIRAEDSIIDIEHDRRVDMVIRYGEQTKEGENSKLIHQSLIKEYLGFYATPDYWKSHHKKPSESVFIYTQWKNQNLPSLRVKETVEGIMDNKTINMRYFNDENLTAQAALSGQGIAIISQLAVHNLVKHDWVRQGEGQMKTTLSGLHYSLIMPKRLETNQDANHFRHWLQKTLTSD